MKPFEQVVAEYGPVVLRVCCAVLGPAEAEDAWSETFLSALKAYPELPEDANVEAWLVTIAHRRAIDAKRAEGRRPIAVDEVPEAIGGPAEPGVPGSSAYWGMEWEGELWMALRELPEKQRSAVAYHYLAGLPYQDIASITGGSTVAARRAAADGIRNLRARYPGHRNEPGALATAGAVGPRRSTTSTKGARR